MPDDKKRIEPKDHFSAYIRKRLVDKPTPPDAMCWDEIEARMQKKRRLSPVWIGLAVAASILVAVFILNHPMIENKQPVDILSEVENKSKEEEFSEEKMSVSKDNVPEDAMIAKAPKVVETPKMAETQKVAEASKKNESPKTGEAAEMPEASDVPKTTEVFEATKATETSEAVIIAKISETSEPPTVADASKTPKTEHSEFPVELVDLPEHPAVESSEEPAPPVDRKYTGRRQDRKHENLMAYHAPDNRRSKKNDGWQISAGFASGGSLSALTSSDFMDAPTNPDYEKEPTNPDVTNPGGEDGIGSGTNPGPGDGESTPNVPIPEDEIVDMTHAAPISFGLTVRKMLNKTIGIETGLIYSYLSTDFEMRGTSRYDASLKMHYLGIPVHLIVNLHDKKPWNIYVAGGGMVEKGIHFVYKQSSYFTYGTQGKETGSVSGMQWSLTGGLGFSYHLYKGMNLYAEPGFTYYFDTNQPVSRRTDDPFNFNLRVGLRYDF